MNTAIMYFVMINKISLLFLNCHFIYIDWHFSLFMKKFGELIFKKKQKCQSNSSQDKNHYSFLNNPFHFCSNHQVSQLQINSERLQLSFHCRP